MPRTPLTQSIEERLNAKPLEIDNRTPDDNWIFNNTTVPVTIACQDMFGTFSVAIESEKARRITFGVKANVYRLEKHSWSDLRYELGRREKWEITVQHAKLAMRPIGLLTKMDRFCIALFGRPIPLLAPLLVIAGLLLVFLVLPAAFNSKLPPALQRGPLSLAAAALCIGGFLLSAWLFVKGIERKERR